MTWGRKTTLSIGVWQKILQIQFKMVRDLFFLIQKGEGSKATKQLVIQHIFEKIRKKNF